MSKAIHADDAPHVTFRKVQKTYDGENLIVRDLNLDIRRGEFLTLLGPPGGADRPGGRALARRCRPADRAA